MKPRCPVVGGMLVSMVKVTSRVLVLRGMLVSMVKSGSSVDVDFFFECEVNVGRDELLLYCDW